MKQSHLKSIVLFAVTAFSMLGSVQELDAQTSQEDYALAAGYYSRAQWSEAFDAFRALTTHYPNSNEAAAAQFFASEALIQTEQFAEAFQGFQAFLRQYPHHEYQTRATFRMGESAYRAGRNKIAVRVLEDFVAKEPNHQLNEFALPYLGQIRLKWNEPQLAQRAFETALRLYPDSQLSNRCRLGLAKSFQQQGLDAEATRFYEFLMTQLDDELVGEAKLQIGIMRFTSNDFEMAEKYLVDAEKSCKGAAPKAEATYWLSRIQHTLENYDESLELLQVLVDQPLDHLLAAAVLYDGAIVASKVGKEDLALDWLTQLRLQHPNSELADKALRMEIDLNQRAGNTEQSLRLISNFRKDHRNSPMRASVLEAEGRAHFEAKKFEEAVSTFAMLLDENQEGSQSDRATWHYLRSLSYMGLHRYRMAERELEKIAPLAASDDLNPLLKIANASVKFALQKYREAIPFYEGYLSQPPANTSTKRAHTELVVCLAETQQWNKAAAAIKQLTEDHGVDSTSLETTQFVAEKALELGSIELAEELFEILAHEGNPTDFIARGLSGCAWCKMANEDVDGAFAAFDRLLTEFPESKFSGEAAMTRAKNLEKQKKYNDAAQMYGLVVRRFRPSKMTGVAKLRRAHCLQNVGGEVNFKEARTLLTEYLKSPDAKLAGEALYQLGWVNFDLSDSAAGTENFTTLIEQHPGCKYVPDAAYRLIQIYVKQKKHELAQPLIDDLLAKTNIPSELKSRVLFLNGQIAADNGQWKDVTTAMEDLLSRQPDKALHLKASYWLSESLYRQNKYGDALSVLKGLVDDTQLDKSKLEPWILLRAAQCYGYEGDWIKASEIATKAKSDFAGFNVDYEFDFVLARAKEDAGLLLDAREVYERITCSSNGGSSETAAISQWRIGETYFHQEQYINAINAYYKVDSLYSYPRWRSAALMQAGKCQERLGNNLHAIKLYSQLLETFPGSEYVDNAEKRLSQLTREATGTAGLEASKPSKSKTRR